MPYKRIGKTVYKKLPNGKLESVGVSDSVEKAKAHLRALYAAETNESLTEGLSPEVSKKAVAIFKSMIADKRDSLFKRYGVDAEKVAYGHAIAKAKQINEKQTMQQTDKLREMVRAALKEATPSNRNVAGGIYYSDERSPTSDEELDGYITKPTGANGDTEKWSVYKNTKTGEYSALHRTTREPKRPNQFQPDESKPESDERLHGYTSKETPDGGYEKWAVYYNPSTKSYTTRHRAQDMNEINSTTYINERESVTEDDWKQSDDESDMAKSQLYNLIKDAQRLESMIVDGEQLDAWVQAKLTKAQDYINSVHNYLCGERVEKKHVDIELTERIFNRIKNRM
jgi:hypothetical protein